MLLILKSQFSLVEDLAHLRRIPDSSQLSILGSILILDFEPC